ncbi:unnamed protein product, partial [Penicillium manginii]
RCVNVVTLAESIEEAFHLSSHRSFHLVPQLIMRPTRQNEGDRLTAKHPQTERLLHLNIATERHDFAGGSSLATLTVKHI